MKLCNCHNSPTHNFGVMNLKRCRTAGAESASDCSKQQILINNINIPKTINYLLKFTSLNIYLKTYRILFLVLLNRIALCDNV